MLGSERVQGCLLVRLSRPGSERPKSLALATRSSTIIAEVSKVCSLLLRSFTSELWGCRIFGSTFGATMLLPEIWVVSCLPIQTNIPGSVRIRQASTAQPAPTDWIRLMGCVVLCHFEVSGHDQGMCQSRGMHLSPQHPFAQNEGLRVCVPATKDVQRAQACECFW